MKLFPPRGKFLRRLHGRSEVCFVNTMLALPTSDDAVIQAADEEQAAAEAHADKSGVDRRYTEALKRADDGTPPTRVDPSRVHQGVVSTALPCDSQVQTGGH